MKRRRFLHLVAAGGTIALVGGASGIRSGGSRFGMLDEGAGGAAGVRHAGLDGLAHPDMLRQVGGHRLVRTIGEAYREENPTENDAGTLAQRIVPNRAAQLPLTSTPKETQSLLEHLIRGDFSAGRTVQLRGWILSRTEARQCALYSIVYA